MAAVKYTLEEFVQDTKALLRDQPDVKALLDKGADLLERLVRNPDCLPAEYRIPSPRGRDANHGTYLLYRDARGEEGLSVTAVVWGPGDHTVPHDHHTWGMIGVLENVLQETRFRRLDDGSQPDVAQLEKGRLGLYKPGHVSLLIPDVDEIHQIDNTTDRPTVEVHVYGRDLVGLRRCRYNLETGKVGLFMTERYDNE